jgi:hypothetical protein
MAHLGNQAHLFPILISITLYREALPVLERYVKYSRRWPRVEARWSNSMCVPWLPGNSSNTIEPISRTKHCGKSASTR